MKKIVAVLLALIATVSFNFANAGDYSQRDDVNQFIERMVSEHKFDRSYLQALFAQAEKKQSIIDAISRPAEKTLQWHQYRKIFLKPRRTKQGAAFFQQYHDTLLRAEKVYGVDPLIIVAILGVETRYGALRGSYRVIDSLSTLGFDYPPRGKFFRKQLEEYLLMVREQKFDAAELQGSYAGAMGYGQFIPSSYRSFAIDFDDDGVVDIWDNPVDAIGSVANYFSVHHWQSGAAITGRARVSKDRDHSVITKSLKPKLSLAELAAKGYHSVEPFDSSEKATVMQLQAEKGEEFWLGLKNFYVITRYNHSHLYAMAVYQLSREIEKSVVNLPAKGQ